MARNISITNDRELARWSREISRKKVDLTTPRIRIQEYYQRDPNRWMINSTLNRLKSQAIQNYSEIEEGTTIGDATSESDDDEYYSDTEATEEAFSVNKLNPQYSTTSTLLRTTETGGSEDEYSELRSYGSTATAGIIGAVLKAKQDDAQDRRLNEFEDERASKMEKIENPWKAMHDDEDSEFQTHDYSSTVKVFSNESLLSFDDEGNMKKKPVQLKLKPPVATPPRKQTLQDMLLTAVPGPGFRMAQIAHPDDIAEPGRRLPSVYFIKPRVRIFSAYPHSQQFWCRQGNPIPVPPPSKRNTFMNPNHLSVKHPLAPSFPFRVRSFKANMHQFVADELLFIVDGRSIFVTGEKRNGDTIIRTVTEEVCLPIDLDLNYLHVVHTAEGDIIFEELWEYSTN